ncbi:Rieske 2Fe-2S domain-containing protein [Streptomyces xanthii]|uniref:Rieske-type oxygenase n=1 Tax=Streptomyces xanthii TaxID=2768069 RepID=A0A7H1B222_9ACTN|nr:Rieske 2Fe-2S domain-containing protein [Streptomyces xanthii]QNS02777.1 3-ketosteroid-9-alpha-hydroxylase subunit A [Streptomyces xanthii]
MSSFHTIRTGAMPDRFARGWHCLGLADSFKDGKPHQIEAFGTKLVVFQGESGELHVLNAYCPHMGGDLSQGSIKGDAVACPFHDWRWSGDGKCAAIPYARRVPRTARTRSWATLEENKQLFVWHDPQGNPPIPEQAIPRIEGAFSDEWSQWTWNQILIEGSHPREIVDNNSDMAHFFYVHYSFPTYFKNVLDGHTAAQQMNFEYRQDYDLGMVPPGTEPAVNRSEAAYYGPSYMIDYLWSPVGGGQELEAVLINSHYPVRQDAFMLQFGVIVKKLPGMDNEAANAAARQFGAGVEIGFRQDAEIWQNKARVDNPLLTEEDGPIYQLRRWYQQFYVDVEDITPEMTNRFEFELDTSRADKVWREEVAENLAAGRTVSHTSTISS